ncbi:MAG: UDP-N-acetylglucosamine 2-epimerase (non-hydrolyzing) [Crocinitomicaceae bacterium]|nr:UDP-N-acetylglucosamine 2-epimerase (non-hydrolyzing) [Crocinitomicaceae bacterium]
MKKKILVVVGTRPNFIKITQFRRLHEAYADQIEMKILHTGQHYDNKMSKIFFEQFNMAPDFMLDLESKSPASQMGEIMMKLEEICKEYTPDLIMVPGDVNSTFATALAANKMNIKFAHIESGLRSFDREMPEEINRILTDEIADILLVTEQSGLDNLKNEGVSDDRIAYVGNTMIDTIVAFQDKINACSILSDLALEPKKFILMTMHRPSNVDDLEGLKKLISLIKGLGRDFKVVFPIHPRTVKKSKEYGIYDELISLGNLIISEPMDYCSFQRLTKESFMVITDSGGIQEETTFYQVPCLTVRENTERPSTITIGTNQLMGFDTELILEKVEEAKAGNAKRGEIPPLWDGKATDRIFEFIVTELGK